MTTPVSLMHPPPYGWINFEGLPPPRRAELTISAKRDASEVRATFSGFIDKADLSETLRLVYGPDFRENETDFVAGPSFLWYMGAQDVRYKLDEGEPTTEVTFRPGPYRQAARTMYNASFFLYEELARQFVPLLNDMNVSNFNSGDPALFRRAESTEVAFWRYVMSGRTADMTSEDTTRDLVRILNLSVFEGYLQFDDVARRLFDRWMIMVRLDPDYLTNVPVAILFGNEQQRRALPQPTFFVRNCLDKISLHPTPGGIPVIRDISMEWDLNIQLREQEEVALRFWHDGSDVPAAVVTTDKRTGYLRNLITGSFYWRWGNSWNLDDLSDPAIGLEEDFFDPPGPDIGPQRDPALNPSSNPWTLWSSFVMPSLNHANLQCHLLQQENFFPNRKRTVTAPAPRTAAEVKKLLPGMPVRISRNSEDYWVTELRISTPPLTMSLDLVYPPGHGNPDTDTPDRAFDADLPASLD